MAYIASRHHPRSRQAAGVGDVADRCLQRVQLFTTWEEALEAVDPGFGNCVGAANENPNFVKVVTKEPGAVGTSPLPFYVAVLP